MPLATPLENVFAQQRLGLRQGSLLGGAQQSNQFRVKHFGVSLSNDVALSPLHERGHRFVHEQISARTVLQTEQIAPGRSHARQTKAQGLS